MRNLHGRTKFGLSGLDVKGGVMVRRFGVVGVAALLVLLLPFSSSPASASTIAPPAPPVSNPIGGTVSEGTRAIEVCKNGGALGAIGCVALGVAVVYDTGCKILGATDGFGLAPEDTTCDAADAGKSIWQFVTGTGGDVRTSYIGDPTIIGISGYAGALEEFVARFFSVEPNFTPRVYFSTTTSPNCNWLEYTYPLASHAYEFAVSPTMAATKAHWQAMEGTTSGWTQSSGCPAGQATFVSKIESRKFVSGTGTVVRATWVADPGYGTSWTVRYSETCGKGTSTVEAHQDVTFTPVAGLSQPKVTLPSCESLMPGSHLVSGTVVGGRAGITSPNPDVKVTVGGTTPEQNATYPLCTTKAPAGGCWLDLQKDGKSCWSGGVYCAGWPDNVTRWKMSCEWGPYQMDMEVCLAKYPETFDATPQPSASPSPSVGPSSGPIPTVGTNPETPPEGPSANDPEAEPSGSGCWGTGWSWNPISWVYVPTKCALKWAFIPADPPPFDDISLPLPPGWLPTLPSIGAGNCGAVSVGSLNLGPLLPSTGTTQLFNTCVAPWPLVRSFTYYGLLSLGLITAGFRALRMVMSGIGMGINDYVGEAEKD